MLRLKNQPSVKLRLCLSTVLLIAVTLSCTQKSDKQGTKSAAIKAQDRHLNVRPSFMKRSPHVEFDSASYWKEKESILAEVGRVSESTWDTLLLRSKYKEWTGQWGARQFWTGIHFMRPHDSILFLLELGDYLNSRYSCQAILRTTEGFILVSNVERDRDKISTRSLGREQVALIADSLEQYIPNYLVEPDEPNCYIEDGAFMLVSSYISTPKYYFVPQAVACDKKLAPSRLADFLDRTLTEPTATR